MSNTIQHKRSSTASDTPTASDLLVGEIAVNTADGKIYTKHTDGSIVELGGASNSFTSDVTFSDNAKAIFGDGSDLQIYHDGSSSYIVDNGTGNLRMQGVVVVADDPSSNDGRILFGDASNAQGTVHYDYSAGDFLFENTWANAAADFKFTTNSVNALTISPTGIDVTGTITFDGGTTSADLNFGDSTKAIFGDGSDLQIYHSGSGSYINEQGIGPLNLLSNEVRLKDTTNLETMLVATANGAVTLYYDNASKLATTSTGIDVTGTANADTLTLTNDLAVAHGGTGASDAATARTNLDVDQAGTAVALAIALG